MPRLGHKKSRNGCIQCKRRRVKCDENRPCRHCARHGVECSLLNETSDSMGLSANYTTSSTSHPNHDGHSPQHSPLPHLSTDTISEGDWLRDLELLHHFCVHTSYTFNPAADIQTVYRVEWPRIGLRHVPVLHGILAVSSLHLAYLHPHKRAEYVLVSAHHQNHAIGFFRRALPNVHALHADALFILSLVVSICQMASIPTADASVTINAIDDTAELVALSKGVETVFEPARDALRAGPLKSLTGVRMETSAAEAAPPVPSIDRANAETAHHLNVVREMIAAESRTDIAPHERRALLAALEKLDMCLRLIAAQAEPVDPGFIFVFAILTPMEFVGMLYARHHAALAVLATWGAVVHQFKRYWWIGTRGQRVVEGACEVVTQGDWARLMEWPRAFVQNEENVRKAGA